METMYTCAPQVLGKIKKILPWLQVQNKKSLDILPLKRVKIEIFSRVISLIQKNQ